MEIIFAVFVLIYCLLVVRFHYYWLQIPVFRPQSEALTAAPQISVIIPVRNEAQHIVSLLQDLAGQQLNECENLPSAGWEVIVVDDGSEDETFRLVQDFQQKTNMSLHLIKSSLTVQNRSPKKQAIWQGVQKAMGDYIITTDGDCRVGPYWILTWRQFLQEKKPALVAGGVTFLDEQSWFQQVQTLEFASLIGMSAASLQAKQPITCNGANLAFSQVVFLEVGGYQGHWHIPSGDDEFLLHAIFSKYPHSIYFLKSSKAIVTTYAKKSLRAFIQQRKRWAGKWKLHREPQVLVLSLLIFIFHVGFISSLIFFFTRHTPGYWWLGLLLLKTGVEYIFLNSIFRFLQKRMNIINFLLLQALYSAYFILIGLLASRGSYTWKNRKHRHD